MIGIFKGLATTFSTFTRKPVTITYPDEKHPLPVRQRSFPVLTWDFDHDEPACTGCNICVRNCPVDCMTAVMHDNPKHAEGTSNRRKIVEKFWIDYARCMRCNICVEVCPFEAIAMDNTWTGHEHSTYDRRELHMDIDDLTEASRSGRLANPFRPLDNIERNLALVEGKELPEPGFKESQLDRREAQLERIARGEQAAIQEREPEVKAVAAAAGAAGAAAADEEVATLSPRKLRARRMKAERAAQEVQAAGEDVPPEIIADLRRYGSPMYTEITGQPLDAPVAAAPGGSAATPAAGGVQGDPNSPRKMRARRIKAERAAKAALDAGEEVPSDVLEALLVTASAMYKEITGQEPGDAAAAPDSGKPPALPASVAGVAGDANSDRKRRARRMRAERAAQEALERGEEIPPDILATITELDGTIPTPDDVSGGNG